MAKKQKSDETRKRSINDELKGSDPDGMNTAPSKSNEMDDDAVYDKDSTLEELVGEKENGVLLPYEEYTNLQEELKNIKTKCEENFDGWQRERADFSNYKKRIQREQEVLRKTISGDLIKKYLPIIDDMERAFKARPQDRDGMAWADGIELIYKKLQSILDSEGVQRIPAEDEFFDPNRHEAITHEESPDHESGQIIEVLQQGYQMDDRILRPAMVRVAK